MLENASLRVTFDPTQGHLLSLVDRSQDHEFVRSGTDTPLWSLVLDNGRTVSPQQAGNLSLARSGTSAAIELHWTDFQEPAAPQLKVVATVSLEAQEPVVRWRIAVRETGPLKVRVDAVSVPAGNRTAGSRSAGRTGLGRREDRQAATTTERPTWRPAHGVVLSGLLVAAVPGVLCTAGTRFDVVRR